MAQPERRNHPLILRPYLLVVYGLLLTFVLSSPVPGHAQDSITAVRLRTGPVGRTAVIAYDNTATPLPPLPSIGGSPPLELGNQIALDTSNRLIARPLTVTSFGFGYNTSGVTAKVRFYANDGPGGAPGTLLFESAAFFISGYGIRNVTGLAVHVPETFTWTVAISGSGGAAFGLLGRDAPNVGLGSQIVWCSGWCEENGWLAQNFHPLVARVWVRSFRRVAP